jgi:hypothetical protein
MKSVDTLLVSLSIGVYLWYKPIVSITEQPEHPSAMVSTRPKFRPLTKEENEQFFFRVY